MVEGMVIIREPPGARPRRWIVFRYRGNAGGPAISIEGGTNSEDRTGFTIRPNTPMCIEQFLHQPLTIGSSGAFLSRIGMQQVTYEFPLLSISHTRRESCSDFSVAIGATAGLTGDLLDIIQEGDGSIP